ncbi:MAG: nucleotidyltransferase domain-containing protein [candidate division WOR-3 bacterium]|nr:nucleotidyltransferase domain-containing protein [candidate division WOR-3 bacterium]MDH5684115.1 nucleotidyltransferase domain-containing protein [candidate division WOR-3 bacterium]
MKNTTISRLFGSKLRAKILGWFFLHTDERFYVRQLAGLLKEDLANLSKELKRLEQLNILGSSKLGNQKYYYVNEKNPVFVELKGLVIKTIGLIDVLQQEFKEIRSKIKLAFIYGSFAKEKENLKSDIDLLVIGEVSFGEVTAILARAEKKLGREINPVVMDEKEMKERLKNKDHFLTRVWKEPKIWLLGNE